MKRVGRLGFSGVTTGAGFVAKSGAREGLGCFDGDARAGSDEAVGVGDWARSAVAQTVEPINTARARRLGQSFMVVEVQPGAWVEERVAQTGLNGSLRRRPTGWRSRRRMNGLGFSETLQWVWPASTLTASDSPTEFGLPAAGEAPFPADVSENPRPLRSHLPRFWGGCKWVSFRNGPHLPRAHAESAHHRR